MSLKRMVLQLGQGTDIHGADSTKAAERAVRDALWRNFLQVADVLGQPRDNMVIEVTIGAPRPETIDKAAVAAVFPYGQITVVCKEGGLEIPTPDGKGRRAAIEVLLGTPLVQDHIRSLGQLFSRNRIDYAFLNTKVPLDHALFKYLAMRHKMTKVR